MEGLRRRLSGVFALVLCLHVCWSALSANEFRLENSVGMLGQEKSVRLSLSNRDTVQAFVVTVDWNSSVARGIDFRLSEALREQAEIVVCNDGPDFLAMSVVMDLSLLDGVDRALRPGHHLLGHLVFEGLTAGESTDLVFRDGLYALDSAGQGPLQNNLIVVDGGVSVSREDDPPLQVRNGRLSVSQLPPPRLHIGNAVSRRGALTASADVLLDAFEPVQGYVIALAHESSKVRLFDVRIEGTDAESAGAEFVNVGVSADGGVLGVVMDSSEPFDNQTVGPGTDLSLGRFFYEVIDPPLSFSVECDEEEEDFDLSALLEFVDFELGSPQKENVVVVNGESFSTDREAGTITFRPPAPTFCDEKAKVFACGAGLARAKRDPATGLFKYDEGHFEFLRDFEGDLIPDDLGAPTSLRSEAGGEISALFYYLSPPMGPVDEGNPGSVEGDEDDIQGLSLSVHYGQGLFCSGAYSIRGTITEAVGAQFTTVHCQDDDPELGGGELVVAILINALPPFDGRTLPPTRDFLKFVEVDFSLAENLPCGSSVDLRFVDGLTGVGLIPIRNSIAVRNKSIGFPELRGVDTRVEVISEGRFRRGDCNFDAVPGSAVNAVNIADASAVIGHVFLTGDRRFEPPCPDACDANDDGRIDLSDAVRVLRYLFQFSAPPASPGPVVEGPDPTLDDLGCESGRFCR